MQRFIFACIFLLVPTLVYAGSVPVIQEAGSFALLLLGLISVALIRRRQG